MATCMLNVTYLPLTERPGSKPDAEWLLEHYDFARARALLNVIPGNHTLGPYIISYYKPLSGVKRLSSQYLYQDLSTVPPQIVVLWVNEFLKQAAQENFWDEDTVMTCVLSMRKVIEQAAASVPDVSKSLKTILRWIGADSAGGKSK